MKISEDSFRFRIDFKTISCQSFLSHANPAIWHQCFLERLVSLKTDNLLKILVKVARSVRRDCRNNFRVSIQNAAGSTFLEFQINELIVEFRRCFGRSFQE